MLEQLQIGRCVPLPTCSASALLDAMRSLLDDPETPVRTAALAEAMRQSDKGVEGAAKLVERAVEMAAQMSGASTGAEDGAEASEAGRSNPQKDEEDTGWVGGRARLITLLSVEVFVATTLFHATHTPTPR